MNTLNEIEKALVAGHLWMALRNNKYWRVRRNGNTQTWKRDPNRFRIPLKAGMYVFSEITETSEVGTWHRRPHFVICDADPNPLIQQANGLWTVHGINYKTVQGDFTRIQED